MLKNVFHKDIDYFYTLIKYNFIFVLIFANAFEMYILAFQINIFDLFIIWSLNSVNKFQILKFIDCFSTNFLCQIQEFFQLKIIF